MSKNEQMVENGNVDPSVMKYPEALVRESVTITLTPEQLDKLDTLERTARDNNPLVARLRNIVEAMGDEAVTKAWTDTLGKPMNYQSVIAQLIDAAESGMQKHMELKRAMVSGNGGPSATSMLAAILGMDKAENTGPDRNPNGTF